MASLGTYVYNSLTNMFSNANLSDSAKAAGKRRRGEYENGYYHPSVDDVMTAKDILLGLPKHSLLPLELVDTIIDHAEYWPRTITKTTKEVRVTGSPRREGQEESVFVVSSTI